MPKFQFLYYTEEQYLRQLDPTELIVSAKNIDDACIKFLQKKTRRLRRG
jgi:hypothetical protein